MGGRRVGCFGNDIEQESIGDRPGRVAGTSCRYAPAELTGTQDLLGRLVDVVAGTASNGVIQAC